MEKKELVLIGNGMAGLKCIEHILHEDPDLYQITVFGSEPYTNYSRIMLSSVLQGTTSFDDITLNDWEWYEKNQIKLYPGEPVEYIDSKVKAVGTSKRQVSYDKLIIATGSVPFILPVPGADKEGVMAFRTIDDCKKMMATSKTYKKAAVIGGGILGLEAARGLLNLGMTVDVIHLADRLMNNQLDQQAATMLQEVLTEQGMNFLLEKETAEIFGKNRVEGICFQDGSIINTDLVVMAAGIRPNIEIAKKSGIKTNRGIIINERMETNIQDIYAVGECAEHNGIVYGLVKPLYEQGEILAKHLCEKPTEAYSGSILSTQLKVSGVDVFSVGQIHQTSDMRSITAFDEISSTYKKILFRDDKAIGAVLFGETSSGPRLKDMISKAKFLSDKEKIHLMQPVNIQDSYAACLGGNEYVCTCNNVSKDNIVEQVIRNDLQTVDEIKHCTKASSSCGGCKPVVKELLTYIRSDHFHESIADRTFCPCTNLTEDEVVHTIQTKNLLTTEQIRDQLGWHNKKGCTTCESALNYYLEMIYPDSDHNESFIFFEEKINAIRQTNGLYTIIPQLYGGKIDGEQLDKISKVLIQFHLPPAILQDRRIALKDIPKQDLLAVCSALDMKLFSFTENMLKSVEANSTGKALSLAQFIEEKTEYLMMPHPVEIKIIDCTETNQSKHSADLLISEVNNDWEIHISDPESLDYQLFTVTNTLAEARKIVLSFIQYFRQSANYKESIANWTNRVGMIHIREVLFNKELQNLLLARLIEDQSNRKKKMANHLY
ncbi:NAD(P)/FAD-dependent oxidoreductase [Gracilibacillus oryzae]|uniref:NAD(P)/FAD-dependent oxidoreductase n=1 Tax=Gracilibacillus oryzae TaxID=1672701 RepID=A0A7C8GVM9_9BACI|nr:nitrite reductase large subunit NirB [Gracilibacillus oryzae]KAB8138895.1 NAD(P)/FAD-dependent oxidoreductase [Gracilibacillus oryzae]